MAIDYFASFPCKVRESVGDEELLSMLKARNRASAVVEMMRSHPQTDKTKPESEWSFTVAVMGPEGPTQTQVTVGQLVEEARPLESLQHHCEGCPYNVRSTAFGCGGAIHYPIPARSEEWLLSRLPADLSSQAGQLLVGAIGDFHFDGRQIDAARDRPDVYESAKPVTRSWGGFFSKTKISSSQILEMCFAVGSLQSGHALMAAYFLGYVGDDFKPVLGPENDPENETDDAIRSLKYFFRACALAGSGQTDVFLDA